MRLAVVGAGWAGHRQCVAICGHATAELVAVIDPDIDRATGLADSYGSTSTVVGADLAAVGEVDGVVLCSPTALHFDQTMEFVARGIPVLVEKPFTQTLDQARTIAAAAGHVPVMAAQILRSMPMFTLAADLIAAGRLGQVVQVVERRLEDRQRAHPWWADVPGFLISHWGSHSIDLVSHLFAAPVSDQVACAGSSVRHTGVMDTFNAQLGFVGGPVMTTTMSLASTYQTHDLVMVGTEATVSFDCYRRVRLDDEVLLELDEDEMVTAGFATQLASFVEAIETGVVTVGTPGSVVRSTEAVEAAVRAALPG